MSFAVDGAGRTYVLDQVNGRIVRRGPDGKPEGAFSVDIPTAQDLAVAEDGSLAVLDRFGEKKIALFDASGAPRGELPLVGEGIDDPGEVTGIFVDGEDVYAEREHGPLVRIGSTSGAPAEPREEIPGRPSRDGLSFLKAGITEAEAGRAFVTSTERASGEHRFTREVRLKGAIHTIELLDTDKAGTIYFAVVIDAGEGAEVMILSCLDPTSGAPVGSAILPVNTMPEESFRDLVVLDEGGVVYALRTEEGVSYQRYECQ